MQTLHQVDMYEVWTMHINICDECKMSRPWWLRDNLANYFNAPLDVVDRRREEIPNDLRRENKACPTRFPTPSPGKTSRRSKSTLIDLPDSKEIQCKVIG